MATTKKISRVRKHVSEAGNEIDDTLKAIRSKFGSNAAVPASSVPQPERISTGSFMLDFATLGGIPHNRISMFVGERHSGKSTMADKVAGNAQRQYPDQRVVKIDVEGTHDSTWAEKNGVDTDELILAQPETGEAACDMVDALVRTREVSLVIVDSIAALTPFKEIEGSAEDAHVGLQARLVGSMIRKATSALIAERNRGHLVTILFINQFRCLEKNTLLQTTRGLVPIKDVAPGDFVKAPTGFVQVLGKAFSGTVPGYAVHIKRHAPLRMSHNHRHAVVGQDGMPVERLASQLRTGDWVLLDATVGTATGTEEISSVDSALAGAYFADGCITHSRMSFTERDDDRNAIVRRLLLDRFGKPLTNTSEHLSVGQDGARFVRDFGLGEHGEEKCVPRQILQARDAQVREFLRHASFDTHGFTRNYFYWTFETEAQAAEFAALLWVYGVKADVVQGPTGQYTYLSISADDAVRYRDLIGFSEPRKTEAADKFTVGEAGARGKYDVVPRSVIQAMMALVKQHASSVSSLSEYGALRSCLCSGLNGSRARLIAYLEDAFGRCGADEIAVAIAYLRQYRFAEVTDVSPLEVDAVDIEVEGGWFFAEGVLTHNSKIGGFAGYGEPRSIPGGKALEFSTSLQVIFKNREMAGKDEFDVETVGVNEHSFDIKKNKLNSGPRQGEFRLLRVPDDELGLSEAEIDDAATMLAYSKKFGFYTGGGSSWKLEFGEDEHKFRGLNDAVKALYEDRDFYWRLRNALIRTQAEHMGMPEEFLSRFD